MTSHEKRGRGDEIHLPSVRDKIKSHQWAEGGKRMNPTITFFSLSLSLFSVGRRSFDRVTTNNSGSSSGGRMDDERDFFSWGLEVGNSPNTRPSQAKDGQCDNPCTIGDSFTCEITPNVGEREKRGGMGVIDKKAANRSERGEPEQSNSFHN